MRFDLRTRTADDVGDVDPTTFLQVEVPGHLQRLPMPGTACDLQDKIRKVRDRAGRDTYAPG
jgi:hypothetical protein